MLAYVFWHRPAPGVEQAAYERDLLAFHRSLAHRPPSGFRGSVSLRAPELPWMEGAGGYEDWYLLDGWSSVGVLEEAAVSHGHVGAHDRMARATGAGTGSVYRLCEGHVAFERVRVVVWVRRPGGQPALSIEDMLGDGIDPDSTSLWRRCMALGPAPELCLLGAEVETTATGVDAGRLPVGWSARVAAREPLGAGV